MATQEQNKLMNEFQLTPGQKRVLEYLMKGYDNKTIAEKIFLSEKCVRFHIGKINKKIKTIFRAEIIVFFARRGWFTKESILNQELPTGFF